MPSNTKTKESPADRFERVAKKRVDNALDEMRKLGTQARRTYIYEYGERESQQVIEALQAGIEELEQLFKAGLVAQRDRQARRPQRRNGNDSTPFGPFTFDGK